MNKIFKSVTDISIAVQIILSLIIICNSSNIPLHWNIYGEIDAYGEPTDVIILIVLNFFSAVSLLWLSNHPEICNFPRPFKDRETAFKRMTEFILCIRLGVSIIFLYITAMMIYKLWIGILYILISIFIYISITGIIKISKS